jgi:hypothetical protein
MADCKPEKTLCQHRPLLLAVEAVGWLHMLGKARVEFLQQKGGQGTGYDDLRWHQQESPPFPWDDLLGWTRSRFPSLKSAPWPATLTDFLSKHRKDGGTGLLGLLQAAHGMVTGIEKNLPTPTSRYLEQHATHMWLASAFGQPRRNLLADPPELLTTAGWQRLLEEVRRILQELKDLGEANTKHVGAWHKWRDSAVGPDSFLRAAFSSTIAETRLPNNEVTLWDQSYVAAALFKSAVAGAVLEGSTFPWTSTHLKQKTRWRLLTVGVGTDHYQARAVRIGDWMGAWAAIRDFFDRVRQRVEVDLAIGSLLYGDPSVEVFSFPGEPFDREADLGVPGLESHLLDGVRQIAEDLKLETPPLCQISAPTRSLASIVQETRQARSSLAVPVHRSWNIKSDGNLGHVCPVCLVRLNGRPADKGRPCEVCFERRRGRLEAWLGSKLGTDTIWINEVADANGRVALLTLSLDLEPWLEGRRLDSLRTQAISEWRRFNPTLGDKTNPIDSAEPFESLIDYVRGRLDNFYPNDPVLASLQEGYKKEKDWKSFFAKIVEDRAESPRWEKLDEDARARWLVHQFFTKLSSPGRVYRFWRQAEEFFTALTGEFRQLAAKSPNRWRVQRLVLVPEEASGWTDGEIYEGHLNGTLVDVLYQQSDRFLTTSNLARLLPADATGNELKGREIQLRGDDRVARTLRIKHIKEAGSLGTYYPVVLLELSPLRFRILVPLEAASACLDRAIELWNDQFARVWDRLPLRAGIVGFPQKLPFQAVIEAVRMMEQILDRSGPQTWRVRHCDQREGVVALTLVRSDGGSELRTIPVSLPDGRLDVFYPYLTVNDNQVRFPRDFQHPEGQVYRHALDLRPGDGVQVQPALVTTLFMDSTGQRLEAIEARPLADWCQMQMTWQLVRRVAPSVSALHSVRSELVGRREAWRGPDGHLPADARETWSRLAEAILADQLGVSGPALQSLAEAACDGVLEWALAWHLSVLQEHINEVNYG